VLTVDVDLLDDGEDEYYNPHRLGGTLLHASDMRRRRVCNANGLCPDRVPQPCLDEHGTELPSGPHIFFGRGGGRQKVTRFAVDVVCTEDPHLLGPYNETCACRLCDDIAMKSSEASETRVVSA
jgi:hypothetical protein